MMKRENRLKIVIFVLIVCGFILNLPGTVFAIGEYDGVWFGSETVSIPGYGSTTEKTGTVIYQSGQNTLNFWDPSIGSVNLIRSGSQWALASPMWITYMGYSAKITSITMNFPYLNYLTGTITIEVLGLTAVGTLSHFRQACQNLTNGSTVSGISGAEDSLRCYEINLPPGSTNLNVQTWGGGGDCDLIMVYHRPDFDSYTSENYDNQEQIAVAYPNSGKWYIGLGGWESYSGLNLNVSYLGLPAPVTEYNADVFEGNAPLLVSFTDQSTGSITSWEWDFGDGSTSIDQNPIHIYTEPGNYTVTLTATGPGGTDTEVKTEYIVVSDVSQAAKAMPWINLLLLDMND